MTLRYILGLFIILIMSSTSVHAQDDMPGAADHPIFPRIANSTLIGHSNTNFGEGVFLEVGESNKPMKRIESGDVTRLVYLLEPGQSPKSAFLNYIEAFEGLGTLYSYFDCAVGKCDRALGRQFIWDRSRRVDTNFDFLNKFLSSHLYYKDQTYWSARIRTETGTFIVSIYAAARSSYRPNDKAMSVGQTIAVLDIVKIEAFEANLEYVEAAEIESEIVKTGHVALYGLLFETGQDVLSPKAKPALDEVAKFLKSSPKVNVYVVGHTDNVGKFAFNEDLSRRRAKSIAKSLSENHDIDTNRMVAIGVGLAAPLATNRTPEGRSLNRRVELVER